MSDAWPPKIGSAGREAIDRADQRRRCEACRTSSRGVCQIHETSAEAYERLYGRAHPLLDLLRSDR